MARAKKAPQKPAPLRPTRPAMRGWLGRARGSSAYLQVPDEWRGTTVQVCGLWPFAIGTGTPMVGVPLGRHIHTGATVCCDPISLVPARQVDLQPLGVRPGQAGAG